VGDTKTPRLGGATPASGRFVLRLPPTLHAALREAARNQGLSLNEYCLQSLRAAGAGRQPGLFSPAVELAADIAGPDLVGVAVFGSWARRQPSDSSDIDILVVVERRFELTRRMYRQWDERPLVVEGRRVEFHVVRLPEPGARIAGVWAEVAIDGILLFERGLRLSTCLADVRRAIFSGRLVRKTLHGQPYWHEVA
jgi:HicB family/Polymerase beta, Nucleotidyltransferase